MRKSVVTIGQLPWIPGARNVPVSAESAQALPEADVLIVNPDDVANLWSRPEMGAVFSPRVRLTDGVAGRIAGYFDQLRADVVRMIERGGVIVVLLTRRRTCYVERQSGALEPLSNYAWLTEGGGPELLTVAGLEAASGADVTLAKASRHPLLGYLHTLGGQARWEVSLNVEAIRGVGGIEVLATTRTGQAVAMVGQAGRCFLVAVPAPLDPATAEPAGRVLVSGCLRLLERLAPTPPPEWVRHFKLPIEARLAENVVAAELAVKEARARLEEAHLQLKVARSFRELLFESGPALERVVRRALETLGFDVERQEDGDEARLLIRVGGGIGIVAIDSRENDAVGTERLDLLSRVVDRHFHETGEGAQGILVGGGWRLRPPDERQECFNSKALAFARFKRFSLVPADQLFHSVSRLMSTTSPEAYRRAVARRLLHPTDPIFEAPSDTDA